jgi:hypothetical protein
MNVRKALRTGATELALLFCRDLPKLGQQIEAFPNHKALWHRWLARSEDKWFCECEHEWNMFATGGVYPARLHPRTETQCLACSRWLPHSDCYAE